MLHRGTLSQVISRGKIQLTSKNAQTAIDHLFDAFNDHDADRAVAAYTPDIQFRMHGQSENLVGPEAVHAAHEGFFAGFSDIRANILAIVDGGDVVAFEFELTGTNDGPYAGRPATGRSVSLRVCDVVRFNAEGLIVSEDNYADQLTMAAQLGLIPSPA